ARDVGGGSGGGQFGVAAARGVSAPRRSLVCVLGVAGRRGRGAVRSGLRARGPRRGGVLPEQLPTEPLLLGRRDGVAPGLLAGGAPRVLGLASVGGGRGAAPR